ncbi:hypothetical protein BDZ94DRAFT_1250494 [Collybia nuda]|uniref:F-box domain-containing protein n=1 Tax=Collybia nuda TaxID=64659 RepID=A0A9P5YDJ2_9AGAR|nr:hypothetical protein BDZ94DRAFT_1250494 [Collybia nuda]
MSPQLPLTKRPQETSKLVPAAPDELWRAIFRFATITTKSSPLYDVDFSPFRESWLDRHSFDDSLKVKKSIVLVCRHWKALGVEFLYEHMEVHTLSKLLRKGEENDRSVGRFVRRLVLPYRPFEYEGGGSSRFTEILKWCPKVEILVQPAWLGGSEDNTGFWRDDPRVDFTLALTSLLTNVKRIDWCTVGNETFHDIHCHRLAGVLRATTNLRYLSLRYKVDPFPGPSSITLPSLLTLRLHGEIGIYGLNMPNLAHIIVNNIGVASDYCAFKRVGPSLRVIQLAGYGDGYQFDVLRLAPSLRELCCSVRRETLVMLGCLHESIHTVRLYCVANPDAPAIAGFRKKSVVLYHKTALPSLERVILHGDWSSFSKHPEFRLFRMRVLDRGCILEYASGRLVD